MIAGFLFVIILGLIPITFGWIICNRIFTIQTWRSVGSLIN